MHVEQEASVLEAQVESMRVENMAAEEAKLMGDVKECYRVMYVKDVGAAVFHKY